MQLSNDVLNYTLALPPAERASLAHRLLLSLTPPDADDDPAIWEQELATRLDAVDRADVDVDRPRRIVEFVAVVREEDGFER